MAPPEAGNPTFLNVRYILQWFSPRWFICAMGTGAMANVYQLLAGGPKGTGFLHNAAQVFLLLALAIFVLASFFTLVRVAVARDYIALEWRHASLIQFYSAISIGAAVCTTGLLNIPLSFVSGPVAYKLAIVFWVIALVVGLFFIFFTPFKVASGHHAEPRRALGFWFLAPVGLFVLVFAGDFLALYTENTTAARSIFFFNMMVLGLACALTVIMYTIVLFRALFWSFPRKDVAPSFMIGVAPVGVAIVAFNTTLPLLKQLSISVVDPALVTSLVKLLSIMLWPFGLWWLIFAVLIVILYYSREGVPITLGYWAYIFPPAAYTIGSLLLAKTTGIAFFKYVAVVLAVIWSGWWGLNVVFTIKGIKNRSIFDVAPTFKGDIPYL